MRLIEDFKWLRNIVTVECDISSVFNAFALKIALDI